MEKIVKVWFSSMELCILTDKGNEYRKRLEFYPALKHATLSECERYRIGFRGESLHWEELDEDIHITDIIAGGELVENAIGKVFKLFPELDVCAVAASLHMHPTRLYRYIYGAWTPSLDQEREVLGFLHSLGERLVSL